jgi:hypothetical protein
MGTAVVVAIADTCAAQTISCRRMLLIFPG